MNNVDPSSPKSCFSAPVVAGSAARSNLTNRVDSSSPKEDPPPMGGGSGRGTSGNELPPKTAGPARAPSTSPINTPPPAISQGKRGTGSGTGTGGGLEEPGCPPKDAAA